MPHPLHPLDTYISGAQPRTAEAVAAAVAECPTLVSMLSEAINAADEAIAATTAARTRAEELQKAGDLEGAQKVLEELKAAEATDAPSWEALVRKGLCERLSDDWPPKAARGRRQSQPSEVEAG